MMREKIRTLNNGHRSVLEGALASLLLEKDYDKAVDNFNFMRGIVDLEETRDLYDANQYIEYCEVMRELADRTGQTDSEFHMGEIIDYYKLNKDALEETLRALRMEKEFSEISKNFFNN
jgi:hypothetical protein